jgi:hypothetical protein
MRTPSLAEHTPLPTLFTRLTLQDTFGKPVVHRSFAQISQQARQLRENVGLITTHSERAAASELLHGAVDTLALTKRLGQFDVKPALDVQAFDETRSVQEYIEKLRQHDIETAIQVRSHCRTERRRHEGMVVLSERLALPYITTVDNCRLA